jgi:hypothetical protein
MADLDELALSLPQTTKQLSEDGRPEYRVHGKLFCCQRAARTRSTPRRASGSTTC